LNVADQSTTDGEDLEIERQIKVEISNYLALPSIAIADDPLLWWKTHVNEFPKLAQAAAKYLGIPPTTADSERHFSASGNIVTPTRCSLDPEKVQMLVFLKLNCL